MTHIYAFGSLVRGEVELDSDIDLLAITKGYDPKFDRNKYSIYSARRLRALWDEGNPFAWHLSQESVLIYSSDGIDVLKNFGRPATYGKGLEDCRKFRMLLTDCFSSLNQTEHSITFELSTIFLCVRNFATCFHLSQFGEGIFSRDSAFLIGNNSIDLSDNVMSILKKCRMLSTRGTGESLTVDEIDLARSNLPSIAIWMDNLMKELR